MRTAPLLPGKLSMNHAHSLSISTTLATEQVGEHIDIHLCFIYTLHYTVMGIKCPSVTSKCITKLNGVSFLCLTSYVSPNENVYSYIVFIVYS